VRAGWGWAKEHKAIVAGTAAVGVAIGGYKLCSYVNGIINELRAMPPELQAMLPEAMREQMELMCNPDAIQRQKHAILLHRLEHNLGVGDATLRQFARQLRQDLMHRFDVDSIRNRLKKSKDASQSGVGRSAEEYELWNEFKVAGVSRTIASIYAICLIHALLKLQLSIVARYVYFDQQAAEQRALAEAEGGAQPHQQQQQQVSGQQQSSSSNQQPPNPFGPPPSFLPLQQCEEVNRIYFATFTKHAQSVGVGQLMDHIEQIVQHQLQQHAAATNASAASQLGAHIDLAGLRGLLGGMCRRVESEALGLECKENEQPHSATDNENQSTSSSSSSHSSSHSSTSSSLVSVDAAKLSGGSASGLTPATTVFTSTSPYARFLIPPGANCTALVAEVASRESWGNPSYAQMASFRLAEMMAETHAIIDTPAFASVLNCSFHSCFDELIRLLTPAFATPSSSTSTSTSAASTSEGRPSSMPLAHALVAVMKLFSLFLPDLPANLPPSQLSAAPSPLFHLLADLPAVKELCAVIYLPHECVNFRPHNPNARSPLQQITDNKTHAGAAAAAATTGAQTSISPSPRIEVLDNRPNQSSMNGASPNNALTAPGLPPTAPPSQQLSGAVAGLPVFDRL